MVSLEAYHFRLGNFYVNGLKIPDVFIQEELLLRLRGPY